MHTSLIAIILHCEHVGCVQFQQLVGDMAKLNATFCQVVTVTIPRAVNASKELWRSEPGT